MRRTRGQEIRRLQKKLIPVNLLVCILCIVASLSLFFMPIIKINLGTLVGNESLKKIVTEMAIEKLSAFVDKASDSLGGDSESGSENGSGENGSENNGQDGGSGETGVSARLTEGEINGEDRTDGGDGETGGEGGTGSGDNNTGEGDTEGGKEEGGNGESSGDVTLQDILKKVDVEELVTPVVDEILKAVEADISVSANNSLKVFRAQDKLDKLLDELFFNEAGGFITQLEKTLVKGFGSALDAAGKQVQKAVVSVVVVPALKNNLPEEYAKLVDEVKLQETVNSLDSAKSAQQASDIIIDYIDSLAEGNDTLEPLNEDQRAEITKQITELYDKTVEQTRDKETGEDNFSLESMITVIASEAMVGVGDFNLDKILSGMMSNEEQQPSENPGNEDGGDESVTAAKLFVLCRIVAADGEVTGETPEETVPPVEGDDVTGGETSGEEKEYKKYISYREMGEGLAKDLIGENFSKTLKSFIVQQLGPNGEMASYYGYIFMGVLFFIGLWMILFLFAFFHMFAKNKRFMMWYVKLFCAWPCIIFYIVPLLVKKVLATAFPAVYEQVMNYIVTFMNSSLHVEVSTDQAAGLFNAVLSSFQTFAWISGICYLLLWIISICWAFPIKHKIRKLKKGR